jgi:AraC family transcriptional regulator
VHEEGVTPEELLAWLPGRLLAKSDVTGWKEGGFRKYAYKGQDVALPPLQDTLIVLCKAGGSTLERRVDGRWSKRLCPPGSVSLLERAQPSHWRWLPDVEASHLYLSRGLMVEIANEVMKRPVDNVAVLDIIDCQDPVLVEGLQRIEREVEQPASGGGLYIDFMARLITIHLLRHYSQISFSPVRLHGKLTERQRHLVADFIDVHLHEALDLKTLARLVNLGACTFSRHFRETFGMAPYAYVQEQRLERAKRLIKDRAMPLAQIAASCGFADQSHLTRQFSRRFGATPGKFQRQLL